MKHQANILITVLPVIACFTSLSGAQAMSPSPDGCYPNFTTAEGCSALAGLGTGPGNTGLGWRALSSDSTGSFNTAVGAGALIFSNGDSNTAVGAAALLLNSAGSNNTAVGTGTLVNNTVDGNTATGAFALSANTTGGTLESINGFDVGPNAAVGSGALQNNVEGSANTAVGYNALVSQINGQGSFPQLTANTAVGFEALANATGSASNPNGVNTALGYRALFDLTDGEENIAIGFKAGLGFTSGVGNIFIGASQGPDIEAANFRTYISNINITGLSGGGTDTVTIDLSTGLLGHLTSSRRYKEEIKPMDKASESLYRLKPVTYRYKKEIDRTQSRAFGLIAEQVAEVNPQLVALNAQGQPESVHYEMVNAMLLNEFLKEHKKVEEQQASISQLKSEMQTMVAQLKEQAAQIQKVSAQLEVNKPASGTVANK